MTQKNDTEKWIRLLAGDLPSNTEIELPVLSGSMFPLLCPGDRVKISCRPWKMCHIGDMIVFREGNQLTVHRLLFRFLLGKITILFQKGDRNNRGSFITPRQVAGKVIEIIKQDNSRIDLNKNCKGKRTSALKKLAVVLLFLIPRYGKELLQWILRHP